jgi:hypothetical protein
MGSGSIINSAIESDEISAAQIILSRFTCCTKVCVQELISRSAVVAVITTPSQRVAGLDSIPNGAQNEAS